MTEALPEMLQSVSGMTRADALVLAYLLEHPDAAYTHHRIELETDLRQPQVSIAVKRLEDIGWVKRTKTPSNGTKGAPVQLITLRTTPQQIVTEIALSIDDKQRRYTEVAGKLGGKIGDKP